MHDSNVQIFLGTDELCAQVAEYGEEMVGFIKACVKTVSRGGGKKASSSSSSSEKLQSPYVKVACILGLRVSPSHRYCGPLPLLLVHLAFFSFELIHFISGPPPVFCSIPNLFYGLT
jgi:hypothetical protein